MDFYARSDETTEWLNYLQPEGLVVGPNVLRDNGLTPIRQTPLDTEAVAEILEVSSDAKREEDKFFILRNPWGFLENVLGWPERLVAGSPSGPAVAADLTRVVPEHETLLTPDMAVLWNDAAEEDVPAQMLLSIHPSLDADARGQFGDGEWEASPHQRLERLLRETGVGVGVLIARNTLRLIYAPRGETAGWISWPLAALGRVEGRPMLAGLKLCLGRNALFTGAPDKRLRPVLKQSREAQNEVSEKLSGQVLGALHELLRGIHHADPDRIERLAEGQSHHLYEGLLTCLMRLVFLLYAEDRDLLPSSSDPQLKTLWEGAYSIKTLYAKLLTDEALNPDTMDERRGGWGQLLAVFRIIHEGHGDWVQKRGGKLFDPDAFPFLEGRDKGSTQDDAKVLPISDGCIVRILHGLMTVEARSLSGEKIRERLSYRSLDVESIGSVYETVMGFTALRAAEQMIALRDEKKLPTFIGVESLLAQKAGDRQKWLKERAITLSAKQLKAVKDAKDAGELVAAVGSAIDDRASPGGHTLGAGAPYLQPTEERRRSGSHYTPRSLTEPIVRQALEPAFERIGVNASPEAVLSLKVLDPASGSGAFLVEACRQLGARLEQAWDTHKLEKPTIPLDEDESTHARRLVAQRCLYGVDRNPMAVDLARLSLWLATLAREHEFSFLDHALKAGDSLVGLTQREIAAANWDASKPGLPLFRGLIKEAVARALEGREAIRNAPDDITRAIQESRHNRVEHEVEPARTVGDAVIAAFFSADKPKAREHARQTVESWLTGSLQPKWEELGGRASAFRIRQGWKPFHWEIEFPEAFARDNPGFDAIVGNPPFLGGTRLEPAFGRCWRDFIVTYIAGGETGVRGAGDLAAYFLVRCFGLLRRSGCAGLITTNSISQGDTRTIGLAKVIARSGTICAADRSIKWPGEVGVNVARIWVLKESAASKPYLNGEEVTQINSYLRAGDELAPAAVLSSNLDKAFEGAKLMGDGFIIDESEAEQLLKLDQGAELVVRPFLSGQDVNARPDSSASRWAVNFRDMPLGGGLPHRFGSAASDYPHCLALVEERVKPFRMAKPADSSGNRAMRERWWQYFLWRPAMQTAISQLERVIVRSRVSNTHGLAFASARTILSDALVVFAYEQYSMFCSLQSRVHEVWARKHGSTMRNDLRYTPTSCFQPFPFARNADSDEALDAVGRAYHDHRASLMIHANEGMTKTYNRFHKDTERGMGIERLRELHDEMDRAVLHAYGWHDLADEVRPQFLTEETEEDYSYQNRYFWPAEQREEVLSRLLALNAERHAEEARLGIAPRALHRDEGDEADGDETDADQSSFNLN